MGVRGLQFYMEKCCPQASQMVNIADLVEEHRSCNLSPNQELVIVVDGSSCIRNLYRDLEWIGGGQLKEFGEKAQYFVSQFKNLGIRLVFFFDGPTVEEKRRTWVERRLSKLDSMYYVLDAIEKGKMSCDINRQKHFLLPPGMGQLSRVIFENLCGCEVYQSLAECDEEITHYAKTRRAFAILTQDSDFVIYNKGNALYLSMEKLDLESMQTLLYDHRVLASYLKLNVRQLPVLATLMGNDIIDYKEIKPFHIRMMHHRFPSQHVDFKKLVPNLANYIRRLPSHPDQLYNKTSELSSLLFRSPDRWEDVWTSIQSYNTSSPQDCNRQSRRYTGHWNRLLAEARQRHKQNKFPSMVYSIMCGLPFESSTSIEDFRKQDLPSFAEATKALRGRIYGILLQEKPLDRGNICHYVPEWCMAGPDSLNTQKYVTAVPPQQPHPGLFALWARNRPNLAGVRWRLFVQSVSPNLDVDEVQKLPKRLVVPTLVLALINELNCLEEWEIGVVLATAVCLPEYNTEELAGLPADPMTTRGIRIANLVMRTTFVIYLLQAACGYPLSVQETAPWLFFDGKLFQAKYNEAKNGLSEEILYEDSEDNRIYFNMARDVVLKK